MQRNLALFCSILIILASGVLILSTNTNETVAAEQPILSVEPFIVSNLSAKAYAVFDVTTGEILSAQNETELLPIASVTKLFTAASVLKEADLDTVVTVTWADIATEGRAGKLEAQTEYTTRDLLWPLLLESSNDAAATLRRTQPDLVVDMNELAEALNAANTTFADASGLSDNNVSTAGELASLTRQLYQSTPHLFDITQLNQYIGEQAAWVNNSPFIENEGYLGGKHGYTTAAGRTAVAVFSELFDDGGELTVGYVVLGSSDLKSDLNKLQEAVSNHISFTY